MATAAAISARITTPSPLTRAASTISLLTAPSTTAPTTPHDFNHPSIQPAIQAVCDSWKDGRANYTNNNFDETFGKLLLIRIFDLEPRIKLLFGFHMDIDPTATPLGEMALIMRALRLTRYLDQVLEMVRRLEACIRRSVTLSKDHVCLTS
jgi:hypothetical protein